MSIEIHVNGTSHQVDVDPEPGFVERLARAKSNLPEHGDGARIYGKFVKPAMVDLAKVGAHYAVSSLFDAYEDEDRIFSYAVKREDLHRVLHLAQPHQVQAVDGDVSKQAPGVRAQR